MSLAPRKVCGELFRGVIAHRAGSTGFSKSVGGSYERFYAKMASKQRKHRPLSNHYGARFEGMQTRADGLFEQIECCANRYCRQSYESTCC